MVNSSYSPRKLRLRSSSSKVQPCEDNCCDALGLPAARPTKRASSRWNDLLVEGVEIPFVMYYRCTGTE